MLYRETTTLSRREENILKKIIKELKNGKINWKNTDINHLAHYIIPSYSSPFLDSRFSFGRKKINWENAKEAHEKRELIRRKIKPVFDEFLNLDLKKDYVLTNSGWRKTKRGDKI